jgi:DNA ligase (NAD+)
MTIQELINGALTSDSDMNTILTTIKDGLEQVPMKEVSDLMQDSTIKRYVQYLVFKELNNENLNENDEQNLYLLIYILQMIYNEGGYDTGVSDYDYDRLYELLNKNGKELISVPTISGEKAFHKYPTLRGTLEKIYVLDEKDTAINESRKSLTEWVESGQRIIEENTGRGVNLWDEWIYVFPKWDGVSVEFEFNEKNELIMALTRGNTETNEGKIVTSIFLPLTNRIADPGMVGRAYGLKTEVMVHDYDLEAYNKKYNEDFHSPRSIASSIVNTGSLDGRENLLEIVRLRTSVKNPETGEENLQRLALNAFERPYIKCKLSDTEAIRKFAYDHRNIDGLNCDGAVLYIIDEELRGILGRKDNKNKYEVAFKFNEEIGYSEIEDIEFRLTTFGRIFPRAKFKPLKMKGNEVKCVSLGSIDRFNKLQLAKGDTVKIHYEIVPYLTYDKDDEKCKRSGNPPIKAPTICPECGEPLEVNSTGSSIYCQNPDCGCRHRGKILTYAKRLNMKGVGEATVNDLYDAGYLTSIVDYYRLQENYEKICKLPGYDKDSTAALCLAVEKYGRKVPAEIFMGAIGIESIGPKTFKKIFEVYTIEDLIEFAEDKLVSKLVAVPGISDLKALKILSGVRDNERLIKKLMKDYVEVVYQKEEAGRFVAVFHKIRSELVSKMIREAGGIVEDNLTKHTSFLIVPNGFGDQHSSASDKARKYEVPIVEINDVENYIANHF